MDEDTRKKINNFGSGLTLGIRGIGLAAIQSAINHENDVLQYMMFNNVPYDKADVILQISKYQMISTIEARKIVEIMEDAGVPLDEILLAAKGE